MTIFNTLGRPIPGTIKGYKTITPYGATGRGLLSKPDDSPLAHSKNCGRKLLPGVKEAIRQCDLRNGMTISFHHHFRNGDRVVNLVLAAAAELGLKDLRVSLSSIFPVHAPLIEHIKDGTVTRLSCNYMLGPVADAMCQGRFPYPVIFRTHGGRDRAIESGEEKIDIAFIAASAADLSGNLNGTTGPSACGSLGYCITDSRYARKVVVLTDHLVPYPLVPASIDETVVDYVVKIDRVGNPMGISSGATKLTDDPLKLSIARLACDVIEASGLLKNGISFQTGSGGTSLAVAGYLREKMKRLEIGGSFGMGGITEYMVRMLQEGYFSCLLDTQSFDIPTTRSLQTNPRHMEISSSRYANPNNKGCAADKLDVVILGATEVDLHFNVNVHTNSYGKVIGGSGGHADTAAGSKLSIVVIPAIRNGLPMILEQVLTVTTPGETVDCIVTDMGIAVNPQRRKLKGNLIAAGLPVKHIVDLKSDIEAKANKIIKPNFTDRVVGVVEYRDGTVIDVIRQVSSNI